MRNFILPCIFLLLLSCNSKKKETDCLEREVDAIFLEKYLVLRDTCNMSDDYKFVRYFKDKKMVMSGFLDKYEKQGKWVFYNNNEEKVTEGRFENSQPKENLEFKDLGIVSWQLFQNPKKGYILSYPSDWKLIESKEQNAVGIFDKFEPEKFGYRVMISSLKLEDMTSSVGDFYNNLIATFKKDNSKKNVRSKKVNISSFNEVYEIDYVELIEGEKYFNNDIIYSYKDRLYILSSTLTEKAKKDSYDVIDEIIKHSFKISEVK